LALDPIRTGAWNLDQTRRCLADAGISILSGMMAMKGEDYSTLESIRATGGVRPDATWPENLAAAHANADLAASLGVTLVTFHAGFLPHDPADPERGKMLERLAELAAVFAARGVRVAFETGQESAQTLLGVLHALNHSVGVNFDPANMILYGMGDPVEALRLLGPHVRQVHIKDAVPSPTPGRWGAETVVGEGSVDWPGFFAVLRSSAPDVDLVIEREAGPSRLQDIRKARAFVESMLTSAPWTPAT
jgi:sugar phosphate isomerase/epimerase